MEDFVRPYTDEEFVALFQESGYDEISFQYCREQWQQAFEDYRNEYAGRQKPDEIPFREKAWRFVKESSCVDVYVEQRSLGHGHEWSSYFAENQENYGKRIYQYTRDNINPQTAEQELKILIRRLADEHGEVVGEFLNDMLVVSDCDVDETIDSIDAFHSEYDNLLKAGYGHDYSFMLAELRMQGVYKDEYCVHYAEVYAREIAAGADKRSANDTAYNEAEVYYDWRMGFEQK